MWDIVLVKDQNNFIHTVSTSHKKSGLKLARIILKYTSKYEKLVYNRCFTLEKINES